MVSGWTALRRSINLASQPARGGSRMTVWPGWMKSVTSSDLAKMARVCLRSEVPFGTRSSLGPSLRARASSSSARWPADGPEKKHSSPQTSSQFFTSSLNADLSDSTNTNFLSRATERPMVPTPE